MEERYQEGGRKRAWGEKETEEPMNTQEQRALCQMLPLLPRLDMCQAPHVPKMRGHAEQQRLLCKSCWLSCGKQGGKICQTYLVLTDCVD